MPRTRLRVLIADPAEDAADSLALMLNLWGYDVQVAYTGLQALKIATYHHPHVVLMALALPEVSARQVAARLRAESTLVAMIVGLDYENMRQSQEAGIDFLFIRPAPAAALHILLEGLDRGPRAPLGRAG